MTTTKYSYHIEPRSIELSSGWRLRLLEDDTEAGGGVFPVEVDSDAGIAWWNKCSEQERAHWLMMAASARPAGAYHNYLLAETYATLRAWRVNSLIRGMKNKIAEQNATTTKLPANANFPYQRCSARVSMPPPKRPKSSQ